MRHSVRSHFACCQCRREGAMPFNGTAFEKPGSVNAPFRDECRRVEADRVASEAALWTRAIAGGEYPEEVGSVAREEQIDF